MSKLLYVGMGIILGLIHGCILWTSIYSLSMASFMLTGDKLFYPLRLTGIIDLAIVLVVGTSFLWVDKLTTFAEQHPLNSDDAGDEYDDDNEEEDDNQ